MPDAKAASPGRVVASAALCPNCSRPDLRRSHVRFYEKPRKWLTTSRPYRCSSCRARFWGVFTDSAAGHHQPTVPMGEESLDLASIDQSLERDRDRITAT